MTKKSIEAAQDTRVARMNPDAVTEAKVYHGDVHYHNGERMIFVTDAILVEVGKWTGSGEERRAEDYRCTFYAARLLGFETEWLPYNKAGDRKLFIGAGINEKDEIESFSEEQARKIADAINQVYNLATNLQTSLLASE